MLHSKKIKLNDSNYLSTLLSNLALRMMAMSIIALLTACSTIPNLYDFGKTIPDNVQPVSASHELKDNELLDVSITLFDPGKLPEDEDDKRGLSNEIRNAEARYMPVHLKYTMQRSGYWGNVRVVPDESEGSELIVKGTIEESDGESIELKITVLDATNTIWFEKSYKEVVRIDERQRTEPEKEDNFQDLYNKISNDIIEHRQKFSVNEIEHIKQISDMRFAQFMAPDTFSQYLKKNKKGQYQLQRLPSADDPMIKRVQSIKARDELLIDTINNYYDIYYSDVWESYDNWRKYRSEEMQSMREIERKALTQKIIGAAAIIGAIALSASGNSEVRDRTGALRTVMLAGGTYSLVSGFKTSKETEMNKEVIEELGSSFSTEVEPIEGLSHPCPLVSLGHQSSFHHALQPRFARPPRGWELSARAAGMGSVLRYFLFDL